MLNSKNQEQFNQTKMEEVIVNYKMTWYNLNKNLLIKLKPNRNKNVFLQENFKEQVQIFLKEKFVCLEEVKKRKLCLYLKQYVNKM